MNKTSNIFGFFSEILLVVIDQGLKDVIYVASSIKKSVTVIAKVFSLICSIVHTLHTVFLQWFSLDYIRDRHYL